MKRADEQRRVGPGRPAASAGRPRPARSTGRGRASVIVGLRRGLVAADSLRTRSRHATAPFSVETRLGAVAEAAAVGAVTAAERHSRLGAHAAPTRAIAGRVRWVVLLFIAAFVGVTVFGTLAWRSVSVAHAAPSQAEGRFEQALAACADLTPLLLVDHRGRLVPNPTARAGAGVSPPTTLHVLAFHASRERLVEARVPLWFWRLKAPAAQFVLRDTGFDLDRLALTPDDLAGFGPGLVFDEETAGGSRVLVWTD